ncbi:MAG: glycosyltransferase family 2 protein [Phycisphaerae bacterium]|nr:glycosyltransferase family 2 protein [Phycisphaerae bacterium]
MDMQNSDPIVEVVIVNTRTADMTIDCLKTLDVEMRSMPGLRVTVSDNASGDGSEEKIRAAMESLNWGTRGTVVQVGRNGGFSVGNNAGIRNALARTDSPDYVFLLNPDTLVEPGAIKTLIDFMEANPKVGLTGSRMMYPNGTMQMSSFRFHTIWSELENSIRLGFVSKLLKDKQVVIPLPDQPVQVDWVGGASFMIRRAVIDQIGLLDETYFVYYEETDYCLRAKRAGWTSWYVPQSVIVHLEGQTTGVSDPTKKKKRRPPYWFASRRHYFVANHGWLTALTADVLWVFGFATFRVRQFIQRKPDVDPPHFLWDFVKYNFLKAPRRA